MSTLPGRPARKRKTIAASENTAVLGGMAAKNNGRYNGNGRHWATPPEVFDPLHAEFAFTLDPCSTHETAKCVKHYTEAEDGLEQDWGTERVFMNPPYGREVYAWTKKARESAARGVGQQPVGVGRRVQEGPMRRTAPTEGK